LNEHEHQVALMNWAKLQRAAHPELEMLFSVPNGGWRHPATARKMVAEGVRRGVPDLVLAVMRGGYGGLFIEMKTEKGRVRAEQKWWHAKLRARGYRVEVCRGWVAARDAILDYLSLES